MTYVTEQTPAELRAHMRRLQKIPGWHNPLDDRLFKEILELDASHDRLSAEVERLRHAGAMLSNCAFNLAQRNPGQFTARDIEALDRSRKAWDEAVAMARVDGETKP